MNSLKRNLLLAALVLSAAYPSGWVWGAAESKSAQAQKLTSVLQSGASEKEKADACRELAVIGGKDAIAALAGLLADEKLSHMARYGLEPMADPAVDLTFRESLKKLQGRQLVGVVDSIGVRRDAKAVKALSELLKDSNADVVQATARALGSIATPASAKALQKALPTAAAANRLALQEGLLRCADAFRADKKHGAARDLYALLRQESNGQQVTAAAVRGLLLTEQKDVPGKLAFFLGDPDWVVFAAAVRASMELPGGTITDALGNQLTRQPAPRQILLAQALGERGCCRAVAPLLAAARNGDKGVRLAAIRGLGQTGRGTSVPGLLALMAEADVEIAGAAQEALAATPGEEADAAVGDMLRGGDARKNRTGLDLAVRRRMVGALPDIYALATKADAETRSSAFRAVGELGGLPDIDAVSGLLLKTSEAGDREAAERALGALCAKSGDAEVCGSRLRAQYEKAGPEQKPAFLRVLGGVGGGTALKTVRGALAEGPAVRSAAVRVLANWPSPDAAPDLLQLARNGNDGTEKQLGFRGYLRFAGQGDLPANDRLAMCREAAGLAQKDEEKKLLLGALGGIATVESAEQIKPYLDDAGVKAEAGTALVNVAEKVLAGQNAAAAAPKLIEGLEKVSQNSGNADLSKKAAALLEQARKK